MEHRVYRMQGSGPDNLHVSHETVPTPGPHQVLVRLHAATLNYRDNLIIRGGYGSQQKQQLVPLSDGAGTVAAVGEGVTRYKAGDRVTGSCVESWIDGPIAAEKLTQAVGVSLDGTLCEYRIYPQHALIRTPEHLSDAQAAALPCAGLTAWSALVRLGDVKPGQTVLTQGTGGVSVFALQFAKAMGARVIATSSSDGKLTRLQQLGADEVINYKSTPEWGKQARALTAGKGVDVVVEVGGMGTLEESMRAVRVGGTIAAIGVVAGTPSKAPRLQAIIMQEKRLQGVTVGSIADLSAMADAIALARLQPVIDRVFPFETAPEAFKYLESGQHFGKVAVAI